MNPYPCGYYGDPVKACTCSPSTVTKYQKRISGPLLDRIDIHIEVPRVAYEKVSDTRQGRKFRSRSGRAARRHASVSVNALRQETALQLSPT